MEGLKSPGRGVWLGGERLKGYYVCLFIHLFYKCLWKTWVLERRICFRLYFKVNNVIMEGQEWKWA